MPSSKELIETAKKEWKNREERKGLHDEISWETGWISGYLSHSNATERDKVLDDYCNIDLTYYVWGDIQSDDVALCLGKDCNYCGRYDVELRTTPALEEP